MEQKKPDILMVIADQFTADAIGAAGHPTVKTPNMDKLAENGALFENAYCNSPICAPSRASFMAGKHISEIGVYDNGSELSSDTPTFLHHLRRAGYETVLSGKMHFIGPDQLHGFEHRLTRDIHTAGFDLTPDWTKGVYHNHGTGIKRLKDPGVSEINNSLDYDEKVLHRTLEQIRTFKRKKEKKPFFLCSSFFHPHDPFHITEKYWDTYENSEIPMPAVSAAEWDEMHPFNQWIQKHHEADICELTEEEMLKNRRAYYGMVTYIDDKIGRIVDELERLDMRDNTIIIITSDHGEMLGEHGMWFKRTFYDPATKIPLIISGPRYYPAGQTIGGVVSLVDLAATIMDMADTPDHESWIAETDGDSFKKLLEGENGEWKDEAICEYYGEGPVQPMLMIRKGPYKYVYVHEHEPLLFDLEEDPSELNNLAQSPEYQAVAAAFEKRIADDFDMEKIRKDIIQSQQNRLMLTEALKIGKKNSWDHKPE